MLEAEGIAAGFARPLFREVTLAVPAGQVLGLCGSSGAGKTTLGRVLAGLHPAMAGTVRVGGAALPRQGPSPVQYLHQAPITAMNPRWSIARILAEGAPPDPAPLAAFGIEASWMARFPHELSGGELMRVSIVRALSASPRCLIADEITAPLDALSQARMWHLLRKTAAERSIGIVAISHDAALLAHIADAGIFDLKCCTEATEPLHTTVSPHRG